jgi:hypothetical protein
MLLAFAGCSSKNMKVSGMICPPGHTEQMVNADFRECRAYDEEKAQKATYPKALDSDCQECLVKRGYRISE